jgi:hypothetical protein
VRVAGSYGTVPGDFRAAVRTLTDPARPLPVERLITTEVPLPELPAFLRTPDAQRPGKVLVRV